MNGEIEIEIGMKKGFIRRLSQFYPNPDELEQALQEHIGEASGTADLFRRVTQGLGGGKSHVSGKSEDEMKGT